MSSVWRVIAYADESKLHHLREYSYHGEDHSLLANYVFQPFWRWAAEFLPLWLAPNLITLLGLFAMVLGYVVVAFHLPELQLEAGESEAPAWVWLLCGACIFIYQTLDALDGKQARRTGTSSPLGELFDHGCDAICTAMFCLVSAAALQYEPWMNTVSITVAMLAFYLGQWEEYHTGMLVLGYVNVTEALVSIEIVMLLAAYFGPGTLYSSGFSHLIFYISTFSALVSAAQYLGRTLLNTRNNRHGAKNAIQLLAPIATLLSAGFWWAQYSKIDIAAHYEYAFANIIGLTGSALVGRLVLARMMKSTVSAWQWSLLPMLLVAANDTLLDTPLVPRRESVYALVLWSAVSYFHFAMYVITTLCETLDINCLTIKAKATPSDGGAASPSRRRARSPARVSAAAAAAAPVKSTVSDGSSKARTRSPARRSPAPVGRSPAARSRSITPTRALSARTRELPARLQDGNFDNTF